MKEDDSRFVMIGRQQFEVPPDQKRQQVIIKNEKNQNYFSLLCRNGPLPQKYHKNTDLICLLIYFVVLVSMIVLVIVNGIDLSNFTIQNIDQIKVDIFFGSKFLIWQIVFTALSIMVVSMILTLFAVYIPKIIALFSIIVLYAICIFFVVFQFKKIFRKKDRYMANIFKVLISLIVLAILTFILFRRRQRLKNLGTFLKLSSVIIKSKLCLIFSHTIILSLLEIAIWYGFVNLYYAVATSKVETSPIIRFFTKFVVIVCWFWTSGALIAFSDYFITAFTVHWFYNLSREEQNNFNSDLKYPQVSFPNQENMNIQDDYRISSNKHESQTLGPIYKKLFHQLGTIFFGAILAYLPLYIIAKIKKMIFKSSSKAFSLAYLSKYGYLDTIMQWQSFLKANQRIYELRHRIKSVMPELYMLGHMYGDFAKLSLILISFAGFHLFVQLREQVANKREYFFQYFITLMIFSIGLCSQIVTNFVNLIGKCGDMAFILYCIDLQIQRVHFSNNSNYSTPKSLMVILRQLTIKRNWKQDK